MSGLVGVERGALAAEETGPEAAALEDLEFGFEAGAFFDEAGLLFDEFYLLAREAFALVPEVGEGEVYPPGPPNVAPAARSVPPSG